MAIDKDFFVLTLFLKNLKKYLKLKQIHTNNLERVDLRNNSPRESIVIH